MHNTFGSDDVAFVRPAPAEVDLPNIKSVAIARIDGKPENASAVSGWLGEWINGEGRFQVVERERLESIAKESGCSDTTQFDCLSKGLPAAAVIVGSLSQARYHESVKNGDAYDCTKDGKKAKCRTVTRSGSASATLNLRLVEVATGKVLLQKLLSKTVDQSESGEDSAPEIDGVPLVEEACRQATWDFFAAISPHEQPDKTIVPTDVAIPELDTAKQLVEHHQYEQAVKTVEPIMGRVDASADLDKDLKARAHYSLGMLLAIAGRYDDGTKQVQAALKQHPDESWAQSVKTIGAWKSDATAAQRQLALADEAPAAAPAAPAAPAAAETAPAETQPGHSLGTP